MTVACGTYGLGQINLVRMQTSREGRKVIHEVRAVEVENQREEIDRKCDLQIKQLDELVKAQDIKIKSMLGGALPGPLAILGQLACVLEKTLSIASIQCLPVGFDLSTIVGGGVLGALTGMLAGAFGGVVALHNEANAARAGVETFVCDRNVAASEGRVEAAKGDAEDGRKEARRTRRAIARCQKEARDTGRLIRAQIGGKSVSCARSLPTGALAKVSAVQSELSIQEMLDAQDDARDARSDSLALRVDMIDAKRKIAEKEASQRKTNAWLGVGTAILNIASIVVTAVAPPLGIMLDMATLQANIVKLDMAQGNDMEHRNARLGRIEIARKERDRDADDADSRKARAKKDLDRMFDSMQSMLDQARYTVRA
ncbi:MAG: hypothetical protein H6729_08005 [Deltaproteobacteria bacterium]|nr:hypothetical protein [Deltaproteobacteria bacterium]